MTEQSGLLNAKKAFEVLEPCVGKLTSSVLRGRSGSNATLLPDVQLAEGRHNILYVEFKWSLLVSLFLVSLKQLLADLLVAFLPELN